MNSYNSRVNYINYINSQTKTENWRFISLFNNDGKLFALTSKMRFKSNNRWRAVWRHINNIHLILDTIDYNNLIPDESLILFIDFNETFDTIEHEFFKAFYLKLLFILFSCVKPRGFKLHRLADDAVMFQKHWRQVWKAVTHIHDFNN